MSHLRSDGLTQKCYDDIVQVLRSFPEIDKAILYGSRAKGTYKAGSDIDLTFFGNELSTSLLLKIDNSIDELLLPFKVDLTIYKNIDNDNLKANIQQDGIVFYQKY